jgi:hypothetical protein
VWPDIFVKNDLKYFMNNFSDISLLMI